MKKVIATAAGLMLAGTMASSAFAEAGVSFAGDARARYYLQDEYASADSSDTHWNSRVRLKFTGETAGGAYVKGRIRLGDATWDGGQKSLAKGEGTNIWMDAAYIGVPFGPVTVEGGVYNDRSITPFTYWAGYADTLQAIFKADNTLLVGFFDMLDEYEEDEEGNKMDRDITDDNDVRRYGLVVDQKFADSWGLRAGAAYTDSEQSDAEGLMFGADVTGGLGGMTLTAGVGYKEADLQGSDDDGMGFWASLDIPVGPAAIKLIGGVTYDNYYADWDDFDVFYVLGDYTQISNGTYIGEDGDAIWGVARASFKATEKLTLTAQVGYADMDNGDNPEVADETAFEVGATASYAVTDGATLNAIIGTADYDEADNSPFGFGLSLEVSF